MLVVFSLSVPWLSAYLASGNTTMTHLVSLKTKIPEPLTPRAEDDCPRDPT